MITLLSLDKNNKCHAVAYVRTADKENEIMKDWQQSWPDRTTYSIPGTHKGTGKTIVSIENGEIETDINGNPVTSPDPALIIEKEIEDTKEKFLLQQIKSSVGQEARSKISKRMRELDG